jgi:HEAT repeat protein
MFQHLAVAIGFIWMAGILIVICLTILLILKTSNNRREKQTEQILRKYQDYFTYLQAHLDDEDPLRPPAVSLRQRELLAIEGKLIELMERVKENQVRKLALLCDQLGLVEYNRKRLRSKFHWRRVDAAYKLGAMRAAETVPELLSLLERKKYDSSLFIVARSIAKCARDRNDLREMTLRLIKYRQNFHQLVADLLKESSVDSLPLLEEFLDGTDSDLVKIALIGLTEQTEPGIADKLHNLVSSGEKELRIKAVKALMRSGNALSINAIARFMDHPDWEIRAAVAKALGQTGSTDCIDVLKKGITDRHWWVRYNSATSLTMLDEPGFIALCEMAAESKDQQIAEMAHCLLLETIMKQASDLNQVDKVVRYNRKLHMYQKFFGRSFPYRQQAKSRLGMEAL